METGINVGLAKEEVDVSPANVTETVKKTYYVGPSMYGCGCGDYFNYTPYNMTACGCGNGPRRFARVEAANDMLVARYAARRSASDVFANKASTSRGAAWAAGVSAGILGLVGAGIAIYASTRASTLSDLSRIEDSDIEDMGVDAGINNLHY